MTTDDDTLDSGVRVLRVATAAPADGEATRARVLGLLERGRLRRARVRRFGVAGLTVLAILSLGGAAWTALGHLRARPTTPEPRARTVATAAPSARRSVSPPAPAPSEAASGADPSVAATPALGSPPPAVALRAPAPATTAPDAETRLYARAHDAHFTHDAPAQALVAWNRYLAAYPRGVFVPDARFNRALCLLRLGQRAAATEALRPFADGAYQGYRRLEAESLLDWIARQAF